MSALADFQERMGAINDVLNAVKADKALQAGDRGKALDILLRQQTQPRPADPVMAVVLFQLQEGQSFVQVALNGAQVDAELLGQRMGVELLALVEAPQQLAEPVGNGFLRVGLHCHRVALAWFGCLDSKHRSSGDRVH